MICFYSDFKYIYLQGIPGFQSETAARIPADWILAHEGMDYIELDSLVGASGNLWYAFFVLFAPFPRFLRFSEGA